MAGDRDLSRIRQAVADRRFRDLLRRARRLRDAPPAKTLKEGLAMIDSAHNLQVRER